MALLFHTDIQSQQLPASHLTLRVLLLIPQIESPAFPSILFPRNARQDRTHFINISVGPHWVLPALKDSPGDLTLLLVERITNIQGGLAGLAGLGSQLQAEAKELGLVSTEYQRV